MTRLKTRRPPQPLDDARLDELALRYVGRFATTRAKLGSYLKRKVRERGWAGPREPNVAAIVARFTDLGYVDDAAFAVAKSRALSGRGYGKRRVSDALRIAGVDAPDSEAALQLAEAEAVSAAIRFAERRRIGPFAARSPDLKERQKALAAMVRAGHDFALAQALVKMAAGEAIDPEELRYSLK